MSLETWVQEKFSQATLGVEDLHDYQHIAEQFAYDTPFSGVWLDTGTGKTATMLHLIYRLVMNDECGNILVIAPRRVATVGWPDELAQWRFGAALTHTIIREDTLVETVNKAGQAARRQAKLDGHGKDAADAIVKEARNAAARAEVRRMMRERPATIYLIHREQVEFIVEAFGREWPFETVIVDESTCLKDHRTGRWKALWRVRPLIKRFHQLTGTPNAEGHIHLYGQVTLLDQGERFGRSFNKFAERYFTQNKYTRKWTLRPGADEEITALISDICMTIRQEDCLDLQQPIDSVHKVHLTEDQMALYRQMENDFLIELPDGTEIEAETAAALSQKLLQMASGVCYDTVLEEQDDGTFKKRRTVHRLHDDKIEALKQLEEELNGETMLIAYWHKSSLDRLLEAFPHAKAMDADGKMIKQWNSGKVPILLLHPQSDSHGLNLQKGGRHVVFFDLPWSAEQHYQFLRRLARQGQKFLVVVHYMIAVGTIDEIVLDCLNNKRDVQEVFFKMLTAMRRKRKSAAKALALTDDL